VAHWFLRLALSNAALAVCKVAEISTQIGLSSGSRGYIQGPVAMGEDTPRMVVASVIASPDPGSGVSGV
jgi:hypothetical protein